MEETQKKQLLEFSGTTEEREALIQKQNQALTELNKKCKLYKMFMS